MNALKKTPPAPRAQFRHFRPRCLATLTLLLAVGVGPSLASSEPLTTASLPTGRVEAGPLVFSVATGAVRIIDGATTEPIELQRWPDGQRLSSLAVLHTFEPGPGIEDWRLASGLAHRKLQRPPEWPTVLRYEIEYADGRRVEVPVRFGEGIDQARRVQTVAPMLWARHHWARELDPVSSEKLVAYAMQFPNPRPDQPVAALRALPAPEPHHHYGRALVLAVAADTAPAAGRTLVVERRPMGDDAQAGTYEDPFGSLQHALDVAAPGDTILIRGGLYALDAPASKRFTGEEGRWLTVSAFPGESPVFEAYGIHFDYRRNDPRTKPFPAAMQHDSGAISLWGDPDYVRVQGLCVQNSRRAGISVYGQADPDATTPMHTRWGVTAHVEILFNRIYRTQTMGIISHLTDNIRVIGNQVIRPHTLEMSSLLLTGEQASHDHLMQEAIDLSRNRRFEIAFNTVTGGGKEAIDCISIQDGTIHHNYVDSCLNGIYIDSWSIPIRGIDIHHNFLNNAFNGIPLATEGGNDLFDITIRHNVIVNSKSAGIAVTEATYKANPARVQRHRVLHNTVFASGGHALAIGWQTGGIEVAGFRDNPEFRDVVVDGNIVAHARGMPLSTVYTHRMRENAISFVRNLVWPSLEDSTPAWMRVERKGWRADDLVRGEQTIVADPLFLDPARGDFRLAVDSPARDAGREGSDLGALPHGTAWMPGLDFAGRPTAFYQGEFFWQPVVIPPDRFTAHRNSLQRPSWFLRGRYGADFRNLPDGDQSFGGASFHVPRDDHRVGPNILVLAGIQTESRAASIDGLAVGRKADRIAFLHNAHVADRARLGAGGQIFHYVVNYADGTSTRIPVRLGIEIEDWLHEKTTPVSGARIGWSQPVVRQNGEQRLHLYTLHWDNPRPEAEIRSIDIRRDCDPLVATPAVFALSTGSRHPPAPLPE